MDLHSVPKTIKLALLFHEFLVGSRFRDSPVFHNVDTVAGADCGKAVGDDDTGHASVQIKDGVTDSVFRHGV